MTKFDWVFVATFYFSGMVLLGLGISLMNRFAGIGLFGSLTGFIMIGWASYHIKLEEYR